jgi:hypothetical protein
MKFRNTWQLIAVTLTTYHTNIATLSVTPCSVMTIPGLSSRSLLACELGHYCLEYELYQQLCQVSIRWVSSLYVLILLTHASQLSLFLRCLLSRAKLVSSLRWWPLGESTDCIAVVTGGGSGLGAMMATAFVQNGGKVYIASRKES